MPDPGYIPPDPIARIRDAVHERGAAQVAGHLGSWGARYLIGLPQARAHARREFTLGGVTYPYLSQPYKHAWLTERTVEVPVVQRIVDAHHGQRILEVGNVLSHYGRCEHVVVDKYETAPGVLNHDVMDLESLGTFDLIVAISTLEHVGRDEEPRDPGKAVRAALALREQLAPGGLMVITVPATYNLGLDEGLRSGEIPTLELAAMSRIGESRRWREVPLEQAFSAPYDWLLYAARGVVFAHIGAAA